MSLSTMSFSCFSFPRTARIPPWTYILKKNTKKNYLRMQSLHSTVHHLRSTSVFGYIHNLNASVSHSLSSTSSGENLNSASFQELGEVNQTSFIGNRKDSTLNLDKRLGSSYLWSVWLLFLPWTAVIVWAIENDRIKEDFGFFSREWRAKSRRHIWIIPAKKKRDFSEMQIEGLKGFKYDKYKTKQFIRQ